MDNINGIPFISESDSTDSFLSNLLPSSPNPSSINPPDGFTGYKWQYLKRSLDEIQNDFFGFSNSQTMGGITVAKEPGTKVDFDLKEFFVYNETNNVEGYQPGEDKLVYTIKIFVFTQGEKAEQAHFESQLEPNEAAFFIEDNTGDVSTAKLYAKFGSDVKKQILLDLDDKGKTKSYLKSIPGINDSIIRDLIENGYAEQKISITRQIVTVLCKGIAYAHIVVKGIGWVCDKLGNLIIENLSVPETLWDSHSDSYFLKRENIINTLSVDPKLVVDIIQQTESTKSARFYIYAAPESFHSITRAFKDAIESFIANYNAFVKNTINDLYDSFEEDVITTENIVKLSEQFALLCGIWNGLVDFVGGILIFVGFLAQFNYDVYSDIDAFLERYDSFCEAISEDFWSDLWEAIKKSYNDMITYLKLKDSDDLNWDKISYITGFTMAFIGTFFIPFADLAKPAEIAAKLEKALVSTELLSKVSKATAKTGKVITGTGKVAAKTVFKLLDNIIAFVAKGRQELIEFFKPVWEEIAQWILKNKKTVALVDDIESAIISYVKILKRNPEYLDCIRLVKLKKGKFLGHKRGGRFLGEWIPIEYEAMIKFYTTSLYIHLNKALRGIGGVKLTKEFKAMEKVLNEGLNKLPISEYNKEILHRSARFTEAEIKKLFKEGENFIDKGFFSSTYDEKALIKWMKENPGDNVFFRIFGKNGKLVEKASIYPFEKEVLFKSGTEFVVESIREIPNPVNNLELITEIILKEK